MQIAIAVYDRFTALDAIGPYAVLGNLPGREVVFVADRRGPVPTTRADGRGRDLVRRGEPPDVIVVPGGLITRKMARDGDPSSTGSGRCTPPRTWTTSVCTGAILLAAAGVLDGLDATTHWMAYDQLAALGASPTAERVVVRGKVVTAAGVSAGIDMALTLADRDRRGRSRRRPSSSASSTTPSRRSTPVPRRQRAAAGWLARCRAGWPAR